MKFGVKFYLDSGARFRDCSLVLGEQLVKVSEGLKHFYPVGYGPEFYIGISIGNFAKMSTISRSRQRLVVWR